MSCEENYCCAMRRHFLVGIMGTRTDEEVPTDMADFVLAWEPQIVIAIKFCPFCGATIKGDETLRTKRKES